MPVWHDVHRAGRATCLADEAPSDHRPRQILRQSVPPKVDAVTSIAEAGRALDAAGHVPFANPAARGA